jgi:hypothetical protein
MQFLTAKSAKDARYGGLDTEKTNPSISESESKGHAIQWLGMIFIANCYDLASFEHFAVNCMDPAKSLSVFKASILV